MANPIVFIYFTAPTSVPISIADLKEGWNMSVDLGYRTGAAPTSLAEYAQYYIDVSDTPPIGLQEFLGKKIVVDSYEGTGGGPGEL